MTTLKEFEIALIPAYLDGQGKRIMVFEAGPLLMRTVETTLNELLAKAIAFATEHGKACHLCIRAIGRKPPGFNRAMKDYRDRGLLWRNMELATQYV